MVNFLEIFIYSDRPTTCLKCGTRTDIILDLSHIKNQTQIHQCLNEKCAFEFIMQNDIDFGNQL